ncbi:hypothetical protein MCOL2_07646 [Listeria fleischmannii FSL S10-1203]|uniref:YozE SAM-like domain-containing protein n=1 Tax=Listeria fleischmannii FSL S10-1203 TaxID=1265822 RepID=W7DPF7_9LIST|nr:hypothetical protein MCOL2_07646 [Listeria fleischmannii FSL S10-1203]
MKHDSKTNFANAAYKDHSFPKQAKNYHILSDYLELNAPYLDGMATFDELFDEYMLDEEKKSLRRNENEYTYCCQTRRNRRNHFIARRSTACETYCGEFFRKSDFI